MGTLASWAGEGGEVVASAAAYEADVIRPHKLAGLVAITRELAEGSDPEAEALLRIDLRRALVETLDATALTAGHGIANAPDALTEDAAEVPATGDTAGDLQELVAGFAGDLASSYLVMHPKTAFSLNGIERPGVGARGGEIGGIPVLTSRGSPEDQIMLADPSGISLAQGEPSIVTSPQAAISLAAEPGGPTELVSLWQVNGMGIMAILPVAWRVSRPLSVSVLSGLSLGGAS